MKKTLLLILLVVAILASGCILGQKQNIQPPANQPATNENQSTNQGEDSINKEARVTIKNFSFNPAVLNISSANTVIWTNEDAVGHSVKSEKVNSKLIQKGESFEFQFKDVGVYDYTCGPHPFMKGKIIVE